MLKYFVVSFLVFSLFQETSQLEANDDDTFSSGTLDFENLSAADIKKGLEFLQNVFDGSAFSGDLDDYQQEFLNYIIFKIRNNPDFAKKFESLKESLTNMANLQNKQDGGSEIHQANTVITEI